MFLKKLFVVSLTCLGLMSIAPVAAYASESGVMHDDSIGNLPSQALKESGCYVGGVNATCSLRPNGTLVITAPEGKKFNGEKVTFLRGELPEGWDGKGYNKTALPQKVVKSDTKKLEGRVVQFNVGQICGKLQVDLIRTDVAPNEIKSVSGLTTNITDKLIFAYGPIETWAACCQKPTTTTTNPKTTTTTSPPAAPTTPSLPATTTTTTKPILIDAVVLNSVKPTIASSGTTMVAKPVVSLPQELAATGSNTVTAVLLGIILLLSGGMLVALLRAVRGRHMVDEMNSR